MSLITNSLEETVSKLCLEKYKCLKKRGKPSDSEWTVLAGFVLRKGTNCAVVSLATGTKCLGANELKNTQSYDIASRLSDSHAEVLARRALLRYLYEQLNELFLSKKSTVFSLNSKGGIEFKEELSFHFYCSQTPCGDCSIILKDRELSPIKVKEADYTVDCIDNGRIISEDVHRTGAKCVTNELIKDPHLPGINYHVVGPIRTKPGRGDPTLSLSCSDKLAKWNLLGIQGALLSLLIPKLKIHTLVIGGDCPFSLEAMERGLGKRFGEMEPPRIVQVTESFMHKKSADRKNPCSSSVIWCAVKRKDVEVAVEGRKEGATKRKKGTQLLVSRRALFESFLKTVDQFNFKNIPVHPKKITYYDCKKYSSDYQKLWNYYKSTILSTWPSKNPCLQEFVL